ncbi:MAG: SDR family NAD(P)-dependent oxidoreductase, partial [Deltaproteobacteria bacterium]|nr:SDR family NAD(P)-dependent oxidoreductase [Deltaproteobacteria bacterium]
MSKLERRVALVTGAARGIGRGVALALAEEGATVVVLDIEAEGLRETAVMLEAQGARALAIEGDVGKRTDCELAVAESVEAFGGLDILVNNAAWTPTPGLRLVDFDDATFARVLETNLWATFWCMQAARPHCVERGGGSIINFA